MLKLFRLVMLALALAGLPVQTVMAAMPSCSDHAPASMGQAADPDRLGTGTQSADDDPCVVPSSHGASCHCCGISAPVAEPIGAIKATSTYPARTPVRYLGFEPELAKPPPVS